MEWDRIMPRVVKSVQTASPANELRAVGVSRVGGDAIREICLTYPTPPPPVPFMVWDRQRELSSTIQQQTRRGLLRNGELDLDKFPNKPYQSVSRNRVYRKLKSRR